MQSPERKYPGELEERKEEFEVPKGLRKTGIEAVETAFKARVKQGKTDLTQSPATQNVTVQIPQTQAALDEGAKGDTTNSLTWFSRFWLRIIKKAIHFGKSVVFGKN